IKKLQRQYNLLKSVQEKKDFATKHEINIQPSPFSYLKFNPFQQIPQDAYHAISGKITRLIEITIDLLSE
ncbi:6225_t:CDS:1, partial [Diversispora eburnea]